MVRGSPGCNSLTTLTPVSRHENSRKTANSQFYDM
jgi:hypothetical protein